MNVRAVVFDFGGVVAEEGFRAGLHAIAVRFDLDPDAFYRAANEAVYGTGYVTGTGSEAAFWQQLREKFGLTVPDPELRREILNRFVPRRWMLETVRAIRKRGLVAALLSDQSDWLDLLDGKYHFFKEFDAVFNSYYLGKSKRDPTIFDDTVKALQVSAQRTLFVDDNPDHIKRAAGKGLMAHTYKDRATFELVLQRYCLL